MGNATRLRLNRDSTTVPDNKFACLGGLTMKRKQGQILTAVLVDYDNIYLALRRKSEEAARRFAKDAALWLREIESGSLITPTNSVFGKANRRIVLNRCYGNPVPRRNTNDNSTDMNSFPFVRHHFMRSGFEVVDCPPLTAQLKNSSDIRMVMDVRDFLLHDTYFDEFIILSGDADFTPVLHRLRAHARRTVIFANDHTAVPYKAISDGEVRESDLIALLTQEKVVAAPLSEPAMTAAAVPQLEDRRRAILDEVIGAVRSSRHPIPLDLLTERAVRLIGTEHTIGSGWGGAGTLRELLLQAASDAIRIGDQPPFLVFDARRQVAEASRRAEIAAPQAASLPTTENVPSANEPIVQPTATLQAADHVEQTTFLISEPLTLETTQPAREFASGPVTGPQSAAMTEPMASRHPQPYQTPPMIPQQALEPMAAPASSSVGAFGALGNLFRSPLPPLDSTLASQDPAAMRSQPQASGSQGVPVQTSTVQPTHAALTVPAAQQAHVMQQPMPTFGGLPINFTPFAAPQMPPRQPQQDFTRQQLAQSNPPPLASPRQHQETPAPQAQQHQAARAPDVSTATALQQSIARIHEACQAPPLSPPEYRVLFDVMAREITERGLAGSQTLTNIVQRAQEQGVDIRRDDIRFVLEVVSESDPWFEQGASSTLFAGRFRNFVVARCRSQGLNLSADELDLIEAWFVAGEPQPAYGSQPQQVPARSVAQQSAEYRPTEPAPRAAPNYGQGYAPAPAAAPQQAAMADEEFPRIVRTRLRG